MTTRPDLLIIGGGAVGLCLADAALRRGLSVTVVDRSAVGQEASWAGAGMLTCRPWPRGDSTAPDIHDLTAYSVRLHAPLAQRLKTETGIDSGYRACGALELFTTEPPQC